MGAMMCRCATEQHLLQHSIAQQTFGLSTTVMAANCACLKLGLGLSHVVGGLLLLIPLPKLPPIALPKAQVDGDIAQGFVQVLTEVPDDAQAYVLLVSRGVKFLPCDAHSLVPAGGVLSISKRPDHPGVRYVWRG